jgi:hypothetical protein
VLRIGTGPGMPVLVFYPAGLLAVELTLSFFVVSGLRAAFNLPAELRANWIFQVCGGEDSVPHIHGRYGSGITPLFALLTPFEVFFRGWVVGLIHVSFALVLSLLMLNLLLGVVPQDSVHLRLFSR